MRISPDHARLERRLRRRWRERLRSQPALRRKSRQAARNRTTPPLATLLIFRLILLGLAFVPFPQVWAILVYVATYCAAFRALALQNRGGQEALLNLFGASDAAILLLLRRWITGLALWSALDAAICLGVWWFLGRVPLGAVALGIPAFALASAVAPFLIVAVVPPRVLGWILPFGSLGGVAVFAFSRQLPEQSQVKLIWLLGALTPPGWVILMLREISSGHWFLVFVLPLLAAAVFVARPLAQARERWLLARLNRLEEPEFSASSPAPDLPAADHPPRGSGALPLHAELSALRRLPVFDYILPVPPKPVFNRVLAAQFAVLLAAAFFVRSFPFLAPLSYFLLVGLFFSVCTSCLPLLGQPHWFTQRLVSPSGMAAAFTLMPVSFRRLLVTQARRDLRDAARGAPLVLLATFAVLAIVAPISLPTVALYGALLTALILLLIPLRWFRLAFWPLSTRPFGPGSLLRGALILPMVLLFLAEIIAAVFCIADTAVAAFHYQAVVVLLAVAILNALLALAGLALGLFAYEHYWFDLVKPLPRRSS